MSKTKNFLLGIAAGASIALGGLLNIIVKTYISGDVSIIGKLLGSALFPVGLCLVCFLGFNLFTGKIGFALDKKNEKYPLTLLVMYLGNFVGAVLFGSICFLIFRNVEPIYTTAKTIAVNKTATLNTAEGIFTNLGGALLCGVLVYTAVFFFKKFKHPVLKVIGILIPIALFVYLGFDHCIANMFYFSFALNDLSPWLILNLVLATLGNSLGAIAVNEFTKPLTK